MQALFPQKREYYVGVVAGNGASTVCYSFIERFFVLNTRTDPRLHAARAKVVVRFGVICEKAGAVCVGIRVYLALAEVLLGIVDVLAVFFAVFFINVKAIGLRGSMKTCASSIAITIGLTNAPTFILL